jgi:hypothetical protein
VRLIAAALALVALGVVPSAADAKPPDRAALRALGVSVTWPVSGSAASVRAGEYLSVEVRSRRRQVRVALVRLSGEGRPGVVAQRRLRRGAFRTRLPSTGGRYRLQLDVAGRRWSTAIEALLPTCPPAGRTEGALRLSATTVRRGDVIEVTVINTGTTCLSGGWDFFYERLREDGTWERVPANHPTPAIGVVTQPRTTTEHDALVFEELEPGRHRLVKPLSSPSGPLTLIAELDVVG